MSTMHLIKKEQFGTDTISDESISHAKSLNIQDHSYELFSKYLSLNSQNDFGAKTNEDPLVTFKLSGNCRPPTLLERVLFPTTKKEEVKFPSFKGEKSSSTQLTIFYSGALSVYDNVSPQKAEAIMLMAGGNYSVADLLKNVTEVGVSTKSVQTYNLCSISKLQAELPISRKLSLQRFFKKRHDRIMNKSPYAPPTRT